jgi:ATP-binding cassette subfamily C protein CydC
MPSAGIRLLALGRTASRYGERLVTHDATFAVLAALRVRLFRGWAKPEAARALLMRPARLLFRLTADIDALESLYLRLLVPAAAALGAALLAGTVLGFMHAGMGAGAWRSGWWWPAGASPCRGKARAPAGRAARACHRGLRARAVDLVAGQTDLVMAGRIDAQRDALMNADMHLAKADLALNRLESRGRLCLRQRRHLTLVGVLLAVGALVGEGVIGAPAAALAVLVALTATEPFAALRRGALDAGRTWLAVRRLAPRMADAKVESEGAAARETAMCKSRCN